MHMCEWDGRPMMLMSHALQVCGDVGRGGGEGRGRALMPMTTSTCRVGVGWVAWVAWVGVEESF